MKILSFDDYIDALLRFHEYDERNACPEYFVVS
jgi:hypothetical protein